MTADTYRDGWISFVRRLSSSAAASNAARGQADRCLRDRSGRLLCEGLRRHRDQAPDGAMTGKPVLGIAISPSGASKVRGTPHAAMLRTGCSTA